LTQVMDVPERGRT